MLDNTLLDMDKIQQRKKKYQRINFWSCVVAFTMTILSLILRIIFEFIQESKYVRLTLSIIYLVISFIAIILMIVSWAKLRSIMRIEEKNGMKNIENK